MKTAGGLDSALRIKDDELAHNVHRLAVRSKVTPAVTHPSPAASGTGFEVIYRRGDGHDERYAVTEKGLLLGRGEGCDIRLLEKFVSRQHAQIWVEDGQLWIRDLGSSNGIKIDGKRVMGGNISTGAELWVGVARLTAGAATGSTIQKARISLQDAPGLEEDILFESSKGRLGVLYRAAQLLGTVFDPEELHGRLLTLALDSVPGRRGFVIACKPEGDVSVLAHRSVDDDSQGPPLSRALIGEAMELGDAVMTLDARQDARFANSVSVLDHEIRAAMCVPLVGRTGICGAIYVDSGTRSARFSEDDLALLTAIGRIAGVAIENARLHREAVERERLAALGLATANLGHCMKNILTGFRCGGEFLAAGVDAGDMATVKKGWPHVARCIDRIDGLVMNMLTFGRTERRWNDSRANVEHAIRQAVDTVAIRAEKYDVSLQVEVEEGLPGVVGETQDLYRVFLNLLVNAIEACMEVGGVVTVNAKPQGDEIEVRITDTGPGIAPDVQQRLFGAFFSTKGSSGTGLGLSTARKIVEEHGGSIGVDSTPGEGASFWVRLPVLQAGKAVYTPCE